MCIEVGVVGKDFLVIAADEAEELIPLSLTKTQITKHFPHLDAAEQERKRLIALSATQRVAQILPFALGQRYDGVLDDYQQMVREAGAEALPVLLSVLHGQEYAGFELRAAKLVAEINIATTELIDALQLLLGDETKDANTRAWAGSALARLGSSDLILRHLEELEPEIAVRALCDPLTSFRDSGAHQLLDYAPLEIALERKGELEELVAQQLKPGSGFCELSSVEIPVAQAALNSKWPVLATHARLVLKHAGVQV